MRLSLLIAFFAPLMPLFAAEPTKSPLLGIEFELDPGGASWQIYPAVASNGDSYLVAWSDVAPEQESPFRRILALRIGTDGSPIDLAPIVVGWEEREAGPAVASNGIDYLVAWDGGMQAARVSAEGTLLDPLPLMLSDEPNKVSATQFSVASSRWNYLVVWSRISEQNSNESDIYGAIVGSDGTVSERDSIEIETALGDQNLPVVASDTRNYLVAWEDDRLEDRGNYRAVYGTRVSRSGTMEMTGGSLLCDFGGEPAVVWQRFSYLLGWVGMCNPETGAEDSICGAQMDPLTGSMTDWNGVLGCWAMCERPVFAYDGQRPIGLWKSYSGTGEPAELIALYPRLGFFTPEKEVAVSGGHVPLSGMYGVASAGQGQSLAVYAVFDERPGVSTDRIRARFLYNGSYGAYCNLDMNCAAGLSCISRQCMDPLPGTSDDDTLLSDGDALLIDGDAAALPGDTGGEGTGNTDGGTAADGDAVSDGTGGCGCSLI